MKKFFIWALAAPLFISLGAFGKPVTETVHLVNGKDLSPFYVFLKGIGRDDNKDNVFSIEDGMLKITGQHWGCVTTHEEYEDYRLVAEFKWGGPTWGDRKMATRDSGILVHSVGEDGGYGGTWMHSIELQIIEGGTGDFIVVGDKSDNFSITAEVADEKQGSSYVFEDGGKEATITSGRINWWGRDPDWEDTIDFRGDQDVENPVGEWNTLEAVVDGDMIEIHLNGVLVNRATKVRPSSGKIQVQSEGAEIWFRKLDLYPLDRSK
ncbi:MAG: DUF1080 domain-containing protein [Candidatus Omnitrophica bacterium]|nr:DUF1080 domain-containing protein [Candidatus Omnitrophota bacterium]